jgi:hypothetical protein
MRASAFLTAAATAAGLVLAFAACRQYLPSNRYLQKRSVPAQSTADARGKFDHDRHARTFGAKGVSCLDCHRFDVLIEAPDEGVARNLSRHALRPGSGACHFCHVPEPGQIAAAPTACTTCHENLLPLKPQDHEIAWMKAHGGMARANPARCETCHRQAECIDCHQRRDSIQTRVHERNFRFFHGIQARANPMQCGSCHREDFCIRCHQRGG